MDLWDAQVKKHREMIAMKKLSQNVSLIAYDTVLSSLNNVSALPVQDSAAQ